MTIKISPLEHQKSISKFLLNDENKGVIVFHSVGSGKTITSILSAKSLLDKYKDKNVIITTPTSLVSNYKKELTKLNLEKDKRFNVISYGKFVNNLKNNINKICKKNILIVDEAHNFGRSGIRSKYIIGCAKRAFKVILLSATPVKNKPIEIANLLSMISNKSLEEITKELSFALKEPNSKEFKKIFKCKISIFNSLDRENFPKSIVHNIHLKMTQDYYKEYYKIQEDIKDNLPEIYSLTKNLTAFLNGTRRAVNTVKIISPKITWTIDKILKDINNNKKILIYSAWKQTGINIIKDYLKQLKINFSEVSGDLPRDKRTQFIKDYNENNTKIMIVTAAGSEGLDLKGTRTVIILEPHWNEARSEQIIGRAIRYGSHSHLPKNQRIVDIYYTILHKPDYKKLILGDNIPSADVIVTELGKNKSGDIINFYKNLEKLSIEKNIKCLDN